MLLEKSTFPWGAEEGQGATVVTWDSPGTVLPRALSVCQTLGPLGHSIHLQLSSGLAVTTPRSPVQQHSPGDKHPYGSRKKGQPQPLSLRVSTGILPSLMLHLSSFSGSLPKYGPQ